MKQELTNGGDRRQNAKVLYFNVIQSCTELGYLLYNWTEISGLQPLAKVTLLRVSANIHEEAKTHPKFSKTEIPILRTHISTWHESSKCRSWGKQKKRQQEECFNYAEEMGGKKNVAFQRPFQCKVGQERCYLLSMNIWIVLYDVHRENKTQYLCSLFFPDSHWICRASLLINSEGDNVLIYSDR